MSKSKKATHVATPKSEGIDPRHRIELAVKAAAKKGVKFVVKRPLAVALLLFFAVDLIINHISGCSLAILYMFGFDGKVTGRMDGNVLMGNGRGRAFVKPALVQNANTLNARSLFSTFSSNFKGLGSTSIAAWNEFSMSVSNRLGQSKVIKGKDAYVRLNCNLADAAQPPISDPPVLAGTIPLSGVSITPNAGGGTFTVVFAPTPLTAGYSILVFYTKQFNPGISRPSASAYRFNTIINSGASSPVNVFTTYTARFGALISGTRIFAKLYVVNETTGEKSLAAAVDAIVA